MSHAPLIATRLVASDDDPGISAIRGFFRDYMAWAGRIFPSGVSMKKSAPCRETTAARPDAFSSAKGTAPIGSVGIRALSENMCEMKRMYVMPEERGQGAGATLTLSIIRAARDMGFHRLVREAILVLRMAVKIYRELGFDEAAIPFRKRNAISTLHRSRSIGRHPIQ
ncbi:MAG: GNAT family N-acetyltransferase [Zoogloeaceae bacterium]|jgi:carbonic anhydrase|nr:GNAT family N-acetyltransferase [Zoogloeaceae bacterium]